MKAVHKRHLMNKVSNRQGNIVMERNGGEVPDELIDLQRRRTSGLHSSYFVEEVIGTPKHQEGVRGQAVSPPRDIHGCCHQV